MEFKMIDMPEVTSYDEIVSNIFASSAFSEISDCLSEVLGDSVTSLQEPGDSVTSLQEPRMDVRGVNCNIDPLNLDFEIGNMTAMLPEMDELIQATANDFFEFFLNEPVVISDNEGEVGLISGNEGEVDVSSASSARSRSQAFHYVKPSAVFETHGIPTLTNSNDTATPFYKPKLVTAPPYTTTTATITPAPDHTNTNTNTPPNTNNCNTTKKKRKRRRKVEKSNTEAQKKRLYALEPFQDVQEEKKRKDAIRAKNCRDKNRNKVMELEKELEEVKRVKNLIAEEVVGRRSYEKDLLEVLKVQYNIIMQPYGALGEKTVLLQP